MAHTPRPVEALEIGQVFLGKYRVDSILGQGGMGVVAECTHLALNERVALKMLRQDVLIDPEAVERFMREAQAAVKLRSEYVARVSDVGTLENGTPYMVMEYLEGMDLGRMIDERGTLPVTWAATLMLQTCEGLAEAHSLGIVHRDIKPSNLFVTWRPDGSALIKVLDFGISKSAAGSDMHLTQTQSLLGTPAYMSPEQMRSARLVDARTDIWSLGTVMFELIEGRRPFEAESFSEMCVKVAVDPPLPMVNAPPELQPIILRCLAKNPDQRYASMAELGRDLIPLTQDPHQSTMLVERMQRMLRRSQGEFEGSPTTGVGMRAVPSHVRDARSQPIAVQGGWHGGSDAAGAPLRTPASGIPVPQLREASAPARAPSEVMPARRASKLPLILLGLTLIGGAGAIMFALNRGGDEPAAPVVEVKPAAVTVTKPIEPPPRVTTEVPVAAKIDPAGEAKPSVVDPPVEQKPVTTTTKKTVSKIRGTQVKKDVKVAKDPKDVETKAVAPVKPPCDAFANPHGCPK